MDDLIPMGMLASGQRGEVGELFGEPGQVHRLEELGIRRGVEVQMLQSGSPCIIRLGDGHKLCFRDCEAFQVFVRAGTLT